MTKLFLKVVYISFLWLILLANLLFVFDLTDLFTMPQYVGYVGDLSNKYFGVSTLINALRSIDSMPIGRFAARFNQVYKTIYDFANKMIGVSWNDVFGAFGKLKNPIDFFKAILDVLISVYRYVFGLITYIGGFAVMILYVVLMFLNLLYTAFFLMSGYFASEVPVSQLLASSNLITPLLTAV